MSTTMTGCGTCEGFGYLDDEDETECPTCEGRGVAGVCDDPLCCVTAPAQPDLDPQVSQPARGSS